MMETLSLVRRNMRLFFRDRASVFFSLLSVLIIILLYALFLAKMQVNDISAAISQAGLVPDDAAIRFFVDSWIMGGILAVGTVTTSLGAIGILVDDYHHGTSRDFRVSPIRRSQLVAGYLLSTFLISLVMSTVALVIAEAYIVLSGGEVLGAGALLGVFGILCLCILSFSSIMCFIATFILTPGAFGSFSTIVGTLLGFFMGIYVPIGLLPSSIQAIMKALPFNSAAVLLRQQFVARPMQLVFQGVPSAVLDQYKSFYGIDMTLSGHEVSSAVMLLFIGAFGAVFFLFAVVRLSRRIASR